MMISASAHPNQSASHRLDRFHGVFNRAQPMRVFRWAISLLLVLSAFQVSGALGQGGKEEAPAEEPLPLYIGQLRHGDPAVRQQAMTEMRRNPALARQHLKTALQREELPPARWRLIARLGEFGEMEDIPFLLALRATSEDPWERRIIEGAAAGLYSPPSSNGDLATVVQDFSFVQTRPPRPISQSREGKWVLTRWSVRAYHLSTLPLRVIKKVLPLRGVAFESKKEMSKALKKRVGRRRWKIHGALLLAPAELIRKQASLAGLARVRLYNPLQRPVLLTFSLDAWYGRFASRPKIAWVYVEPAGQATVDVPVEPMGFPDGPPIRLDLRMREVNKGFVPSFFKLYLPLQP